MDLFFTYGDWWSPLPPPYGNVTIEGNRFETPAGQQRRLLPLLRPLRGNTAPGPGPIDGWTIRKQLVRNRRRHFDTRTMHRQHVLRQHRRGTDGRQPSC